MARVRNSEMPNLFIIGAAKCGTTSLHHYLNLHPEISMSLDKEPNFFADPEAESINGRVGDRSTYLSLFEEGAPIRGEASTAYSRFPLIDHVPSAIAAECENPKFVYLVRDPVDRAEAEIRELMSSRNGAMKHVPADISAEDLIGNVDDPFNRFLTSGFFMTQIARYLEYFPRESILVIDSDELRSNRRLTLATIFRFLGLDDSFWDDRIESELNTAAHKKRRSDLYVRLSEIGPLKAVVDRMPLSLKRQFFRVARPAMSSLWEPPEFDHDLRLRLRELYRPEVEEFRQFTGQDFGGWGF